MSKNQLSDQAKKEIKSDHSNRILLIDEVDVFFRSYFYGKSYNPVMLLTNDDLIFIMKEIW